MNTSASTQGGAVTSALAHVRRLIGQVNADTLALALELVAGIRSAADILRPLADLDTEAGHEAAIALQILDDLVASAEPPPAT